ncbi:MAG: TPM domain-containing protein [Bacteroidales bacterium]|nr:TPM domain-containing protein [Bacteroidales bacterium]
MTRIINILIIAILLPLSTMAQEWLQDVERTEQNLQIHKQDILDRMANDEYRRQEATQHALRTPYVKPEYKVYDFAGVLSDTDAENIRTRINAMIKENQLDAAVVFISESNWFDFDNEDFCKDFYDYNDFGCGPKHDGICFVINLATRRFAIFDTGTPTQYSVVGSNLYKYETEILQPYFRNGDYAGGVVECISEFERDFLYERDTPWWQRPEYWIAFGIALLLSFIIVMIRSRRKCKIQKAVLATNYEVPNSFKLTIKRDTFVSTHTTKQYIPPSSSSSGGSSSGTSHSGGSGGW